MADTYTLISSVTVGAGGAASIGFSSIPQTYTDLLFVCSVRSTYPTNGVLALELSVNGSFSSLSDKSVRGDGASASSANDTTAGYVGFLTGSTATANTFGNTAIYLPNYAGSNNKSYSSDSVYENNGTTAYASLWAGLRSSTAAITDLAIYDGSSGYNFAQYSTAYLYGIKNS